MNVAFGLAVEDQQSLACPPRCPFLPLRPANQRLRSRNASLSGLCDQGHAAVPLAQNIDSTS
jgi:hypothetical protein